MLPARHHWFVDKFFDAYIRFLLNRHFSKIEVEGIWPVTDESQLVIGNHVSWWDGFWVYYLNKKLLRKRFYVMMLKQQLERNSILSRIGAFSIDPGSRSVVKSLAYASDKLKEAGNLVVIYPQGVITSVYAGVPSFKKGLDHIISKSGVKSVLFYVALTDYFSQKKPVLTFYIGCCHLDGVAHVEDMYREFYHAAVARQAQRIS